MHPARTRTPAERSPRRRRTPLRIVGAVVVALAAASAAWLLWPRDAADAIPALQEASVTLRPYRITVAGAGVLAAARSRAVSSPLAGTVVQLPQVGDRVSAGAVVARLDAAPFERVVEDAELALERARNQLASLVATQAGSVTNDADALAAADQRLGDMEPALLLADEPTGNLDTRTGNEIMALFHDLNQQGATLVVVTHEAEIAAQCRRTVTLRDGLLERDERHPPRLPLLGPVVQGAPA